MTFQVKSDPMICPLALVAIDSYLLYFLKVRAT